MQIKVRVAADAKRETLKKISANAFHISVREKPQENRANERARLLLAREYRVPIARVRLVRGHHRPSKVFEIRAH